MFYIVTMWQTIKLQCSHRGPSLDTLTKVLEVEYHKSDGK